MKHRAEVAIALVVLLASEAFAWNALGHKVVAEIAWRQLEPAKRQGIVDVLRRHPRFDADFAGKMTDDALAGDKATQDRWIFLHASYWPDIARGLKGEELAKYNRPTWHYVTNPLFLDPNDRVLQSKLGITNSAEYPTDTPKDEYNVLQAIQHAQAAIKSRAGADVKALAYCWLFHLVGDIHQPLHSTSLFSVGQFPLGDRGGNGIPLTGGQNLHARWDGLLGRRNLLRDVDRDVAELADAPRYGDVWNSPAAKELNPQKWAAESHELCKTVVYSDAILDAVRATPAGEKMVPLRLPETYWRQAGSVARRRMIIAGIRLAILLGAERIERPITVPVQPIRAPVYEPPTPEEDRPPSVLAYWLNTSSNVRHNRSCEWFGNTKRGRYCSADEGKPCGECGR